MAPFLLLIHQIQSGFPKHNVPHWALFLSSTSTCQNIRRALSTFRGEHNNSICSSGPICRDEAPSICYYCSLAGVRRSHRSCRDGVKEPCSDLRPVVSVQSDHSLYVSHGDALKVRGWDCVSVALRRVGGAPASCCSHTVG